MQIKEGKLTEMKMISRILLLLILSSCLCATFVVNVKQSSYQAEENHSITLEWTFTTKTQGSWKNLFIICDFRSSVKSGVTIYVHHDGDEFPESQHEQFSGRVQIDKDVLREGRIRFHVSRLRTEDSGLYLCDVKTEDGSSNAECRLNVTGKNGAQGNLTGPGGPDPGVTVGVGVLALIILIFIIIYVVRRHRVKKFFHAGTTSLKTTMGEMMKITKKMAKI
ncbi:uncharacterized protein LOC111611213 isoform X2 [Xiphophorus maculatus]|uniref:uncharacterized protein LOC111611213 isoform X2 n=1 Tax=Xiphophorus maculatus TaxID=8083 RepID=UPI000C6DD685|nr:uncharacterized protein LOC111611213 isoform X2 [Xiphophorus maculatus]